MSYIYRSKRRSTGNFSRTKSSTASRGNKRRGQYIDPRKFVASAQINEVEAYEAQNSFADFKVSEVLHNNLIRKGYDTPSPIQDQTIPLGLAGKDVIGLAGTGTGKTAAFAIPIMQSLITDNRAKAIIVAPTRELAQQIEEEFNSLASGCSVRSILLIGGTGMTQQLRQLKTNPRLIIGTPGRINDHIRRRSLNLNFFNLAVLDEVDRMLDMGFIKDVTTILEHISSNRQMFFFSATMVPKVRTLIETFSREPVLVSIKASSASENVNQDVVHYESSHDKLDKLHSVLIDNDTHKAIIFDETQRSVERLHKELEARGFKAEAIHGGKTQGQRRRALDNFKQNKAKVLVATDVAARGIDVADITHVVNYSIPQSYDDYIHRIGRAGRAGKVGHALTFVDKKEAR